MHNRHDVANILKKAESKFGRILVLTGARQTGKTTLVRRFFANYTYISIEDPVMRKTFADLTAQQWKTLYPNAILDEVQKEPQLIESIKSTYDQWDEPRYILLGSSQLLLMEKVNHTDARHLFRLDEILDKPIKKVFLLSNDQQTKYFDEKTIAIHAAYFLG